MCSYFDYRIYFILLWIQSVKSMTLKNAHSYFMDTSGSEAEEFILSKGYLPKESRLPKASLTKQVDNDVTYLLSKLSDEELIRLLKDQPKKNVYDLNDIVRVAVDPKPLAENKELTSVDQQQPVYESQGSKPNRFRTLPREDKPQQAFFRLEDKPVDPFLTKTDSDSNYAALQKLNNLLYSHPQEAIADDKSDEEEEKKKELMFDVLVAQLKTLCCKKSKPSKRQQKKVKLQSLLDNYFSQSPKAYTPEYKPAQTKSNNLNEYMFLIMNDEIKSNGSDELISVDPESLERNSSVLLLGPIQSPLTDSELKSVMDRISNELSKPDYVALLQQLSDGTLNSENVKLMKSLVTGPDTRRYIKPHRCNHQSPLAKVYGGPKWLICTGYLNLNTPSLYDK